MAGADQTPTRRSGRGRVPNRKYEEETLQILKGVLSSDSDEEENLAHAEVRAAKRAGDDDFDAAEVVDVSSESDGTSVRSAQSSDIHTPVEDSEDARSYADESDPEQERIISPAFLQKIQRPWKQKIVEGSTRSRGLAENPISKYRRVCRLLPLAGPASEDQMPIVNSVQHWGAEPTLPRKSNLRYPFTSTEEKREFEATKAWDWYYEHDGRDAFAKRQKVSDIDEDDGLDYFPRSSSQAGHDVLLGPYGRQKFFHLAGNQALSLGEAWKEAIRSHGATASQERSQGWLLNVGARVRSMDWTPNQTGSSQYLALSTKASLPTGQKVKEAPAFNPCPPTKSTIHIWRFPASANEALHGERPAELVQVLCHDWGDAKHLKWCPLPRQFRDIDHQGNSIPLGLLAGVFDDGTARVLDLSLQQNQEKTPVYSKISASAVTFHPLSNTIITTLAWLTNSDIALGHSNGYLTVFSLKQPPSNPSAMSSTPPNPWLTTRLHQSYILCLTPSPPFPHLLSSSSISGHTRLTSLLHPQSGNVLSRRMHMPPTSLAYHHALHGCVFPDDGRGMINFTGLRFWGNTINIAEAKGVRGIGGAGGIMAVDVGKAHASMAFGCCDGQVFVSNPVRFVWRGSIAVWQVCVFRNEWVRRKTPQSNNGGAGTGSKGSDGEKGEDGEELVLSPGQRGISRVTEAYKAVQAELDVSVNRNAVKDTGKNMKAVLPLTLHEEETAVTALCWNPNLQCGGWLAAGWGNGLLRVEDVSI